MNAHIKEHATPTTFEDFMPRGKRKEQPGDNMPAFDDLASRFMSAGANIVKPETKD